MDYKEYYKTLDIARKICEAIYPKPTSHTEWADMFNKIGNVNLIIMESFKNETQIHKG